MRGAELPIPFGLWEAVLVFVVVWFGAAVQSAVGFGVALIAAPVLILIHPPFVPGPLMAGSVVLTIAMAHRDRASIDLSGLGFAMAGRVVGIAGAAWFLVTASREAFDLAFGVLVLFGVVLSLLGLQVRPTRTGATIAGALSGLMGTISSIGGPPMALLYQDSGVARLRGTLSGFFVVGTTLSVVVLAAIGRYGRDEVVLSLLLTPPVLVGFYSAAPLRRFVNEGTIRPLVLGLSSCSAIVVLWRAWQQAGG